MAAGDELIDTMVEASFAIIAEVTRVGAERDASLTMVRMLGVLRDRTVTMAQLADFLGLERSTVSGLVDRAERRGLVSRQASAADRRSTELALTDAGRALAHEAATEIGRRISPIVARLPLRVEA